MPHRRTYNKVKEVNINENCNGNGNININSNSNSNGNSNGKGNGFGRMIGYRKGRFMVKLLVLIFLATTPDLSIGQRILRDSTHLSLWQPSEVYSPRRFWTITGTGAVIYTGALIGMNELWYKQFPRSEFHFFDDSKEWNQMDKAGHLFTGYFESVWTYKGAKWTGMKDKKAMLVGAGMGMLLQSSVEVLDGFSTEWGFSISDMAFNTLGVGAFYAQQKHWGEQRISFKISATKRKYSSDEITSSAGNATTSLKERTDDLYGTNLAESFLKDYNAQTVWASLNIHSFLREESKFPKWLNIAIGYGAENLYGGFGNNWQVDDASFNLPSAAFPRYRQFYISPDIDFTRIPTRKKGLKTLFTILNIFKFPAPALELNSNGGVKFFGVYY